MMVFFEGLLIGILLTAGAFGLYAWLMKRTHVSEPATAETLLQRATLLLHQIRVIAAANIVAFIVLGTLATIGFARLGDSNNAFTELNRVTICDLYQQIDRTPPAALKCAGR